MKHPLLTLAFLLLLSLGSSAQNHQLLLNRGHNRPIRKILFVGDGSRTVSADQGGKLVLWDMNLNLVLHSQQPLNTDIRQMQLLGDSLLVICGDYGLESYRLGSGSLEKQDSFVYPYAACMQVQPDHWKVANSSGQILSLKQGPEGLYPTDTLTTQTEGLFWFRVLRDKLYTIGLHTHQVLSLSGRELYRGRAQALAYDYSWNDKTQQLVATGENKLVVFELTSKKILTKTIRLEGLALSVNWLSDTELMAGTNTGTLYQLQLARGTSRRLLPQAPGRSFTALAVQQNMLAIGDFRGQLEVRLRNDLEKILQLAADEAGQITKLQFCPRAIIWPWPATMPMAPPKLLGPAQGPHHLHGHRTGSG
ncbi:hypothetical protein [Cesiribacter andamanensis]|uniref:Uncharacterized protein n=1 Tax=Cesiribacter andamanensis AMV16 TaxID=1279009 RepID=M7N7M0_9BACT|nr:hypothetical protein [Cesiribacter andamanensis]EMR03226.1 hypothetical protein ADICEAN_01619 [Cesiribacter andamanensis AMV16]